MSRNLALWLAIGMTSLFFCGTAHAAIYDLNSDWSSIDNITGEWAFKQGVVALPFQSDFFGNGTNQPAWAPEQWPLFNHAPFLLKTQTTDYDYQIGDVLVHAPSHTSSASMEPLRIIWTSPITGTAAVAGNIWWGGWEDQDRGTYWELYHNGTLLDSGAVGTGDAFSRNIPMGIIGGGILNIGAGDTISLLFTQTTPTRWSWYTGVNLTIDAQPVPLPGALLLLGSGLIGLAGTRIKRKKQ